MVSHCWFTMGVAGLYKVLDSGAAKISIDHIDHIDPRIGLRRSAVCRTLIRQGFSANRVWLVSRFYMHSASTAEIPRL